MQQNMDNSTYDDMSYDSNSQQGREARVEPSKRHVLLGWGALQEATRCLKSVAHPVRLRILELLLEGEYAVGELADLCEVDQPTASGHLRQLRDRGILDQRRDGRHVYYRVAAAAAIEGIVTCMRKNFGPTSTGNGCRG